MGMERKKKAARIYQVKLLTNFFTSENCKKSVISLLRDQWCHLTCPQGAKWYKTLTLKVLHHDKLQLPRDALCVHFVICNDTLKGQ